MPRPHFRQAFQIAALTVLLTGAPAMAQAPAVTGAGSASSAAPGAPCVLLFGQGRNFDPEQPAANRRWDEANGAFNLAVREPLAAAGLPVINLVLPVSATDLPRNLQGLLAEVQRRGCTRVLETALFADVAQGLLIARLRVYPVLGLLGPQAAGSQPRIGAVAYTQQKEFTLDARVMDRVNPSRLGRVMGAEAAAALVGPRE
ncbi:hypothetical protein FHT39_004290 [Mitsuaria sp. BK045]|uniref:hypothetical protein n=1 Tax=unclassified Roseateles TaxID=2626991 RepID=UPI0016097A59|nr:MULTISPECIES: hypothetical protein [unclassified Roseateles]MBB3295610.1 hypothetical protein [Mitsuaria sp. BK041]MBB3364826.1 hypothetical protein [Mitsuaria sp. BK045]